jgi:hypothetical protein
MLSNMRSIPVLLSACIALLPLLSIGQTTPSHAPPNTPNVKRIEGTVARVDGNEFLLRVKGGTTETYQLSPAVQIVLARPGLMTDLTPGKSAGCTGIYNDGAAELASECHVFSDGMHGFAQAPGPIHSSSTPTIEGTITDVRANLSADNGKGTHLLVRIGDQGNAMTMKVSSLTEITVIKPGDASALKPGANVRGISQQAVDGTGVIQMLTIMAPGAGKHDGQ